MRYRRYFISFCVILIAGFLLRMTPYFNSNFYFTIDQGRDAVYVRDMLVRGSLPILGPETSVNGVYHGVLWYYFIAAGYALFGGHPFGAVFMLILLNTVTAGVLMWYLAKKLSPAWALVAGGLFQIFWGFYETSRYAFNPFALSPFTILALILILEAAEGNRRAYLWAAIPVGLTFHAHIVAAVPIVSWYFAVGILYYVRRRTTLSDIFLGFVITISFLIPHAISEVTNGFSQVHAIQAEFSKPAGYFAKSSENLWSEFLALVNGSVLPQVSYVGSALFAVAIIAAFLPFKFTPIPRKEQQFTQNFIGATFLLVGISYLWYATNSTWRPWQTVYIPPLLFLSFILAIRSLPHRFAIVLIVLLIGVQGSYFWYRLHSDSPGDPSFLATELGAVDWVYQKSEGRGFSVYTYLPSVLDYPYQYLIWWRGKKTYGYLPCEYASYPGSPKLFIPGSSYYDDPKRECTNLRFLIVEPDNHTYLRNQWLAEVHRGTNLVEQSQIGKITLEKRTF